MRLPVIVTCTFCTNCTSNCLGRIWVQRRLSSFNGNLKNEQNSWFTTCFIVVLFRYEISTEYRYIGNKPCTVYTCSNGRNISYIVENPAVWPLVRIFKVSSLTLVLIGSFIQFGSHEVQYVWRMVYFKKVLISGVTSLILGVKKEGLTKITLSGPMQSPIYYFIMIQGDQNDMTG